MNKSTKHAGIILFFIFIFNYNFCIEITLYCNTTTTTLPKINIKKIKSIKNKSKINLASLTSNTCATRAQLTTKHHAQKNYQKKNEKNNISASVRDLQQKQKKSKNN